MFVKTLPSRQGFCVCVIGVLSGSVREVVSLMRAMRMVMCRTTAGNGLRPSENAVSVQPKTFFRRPLCVSEWVGVCVRLADAVLWRNKIRNPSYRLRRVGLDPPFPIIQIVVFKGATVIGGSRPTLHKPDAFYFFPYADGGMCMGGSGLRPSENAVSAQPKTFFRRPQSVSGRAFSLFLYAAAFQAELVGACPGRFARVARGSWNPV